MTEPTWDIRQGDVLDRLREMPDGSIHCCVTSPPYWGLRDYGTGTWEGGKPACAHRVGGRVQDSKAPGAIASGVRPGVDASTCLDCGATRKDRQLGLEPTPEEYVARMVEVFREVRRVLRDDGTLWLNLGDSYAGAGKTGGGVQGASERHAAVSLSATYAPKPPAPAGTKPKDLVGIPWRVAFALQADGWYLRSDIIWAKPNPMPESVRDRPTKAHEYVFLLTKSAQYHYDADAIAEPATYAHEAKWDNGENGHGGGESHAGQGSSTRKFRKTDKQRGHGRRHAGFNDRWDEMEKAEQCSGTRNRRSVWTIATKPYPEAHFATFPPELPELCIKAGTSERGCCSRCGAPWERVRERVSTGKSYSTGKSLEKNRAGLVTGFPGYDDGSSAPVFKTTGWRPTCDCGADVAGCTVLDPFCGAATTGLVAVVLGRSFTGIELNQEYVEMGKRRIMTETWRQDADGWQPPVDDLPLFAGAGGDDQPPA